MQTRSLSE